MTRIIAISDTHGRHFLIEDRIPDGDILVHAGDFCGRGNMMECKAFLEWFAAQRHAHKICIAGNHDVWMEKGLPDAIESIIPRNVTYLNDSGCEVRGIKFWGSPVQPTFYDWAFNRDRGDPIQKHWDLIPNSTDILLTHGPAHGHCDQTIRGDRPGCKNLYAVIHDRVKPRLHIFGHIHFGYGTSRSSDNIHFVNASICDEYYQPENDPWVITLDDNGKVISVAQEE